MNKNKKLAQWMLLTLSAIKRLKKINQDIGKSSATIHHQSGSKTFYSVKEAEEFLKKLKKSQYSILENINETK